VSIELRQKSKALNEKVRTARQQGDDASRDDRHHVEGVGLELLRGLSGGGRQKLVVVVLLAHDCAKSAQSMRRVDE
jgi:hypothetical protein